MDTHPILTISDFNEVCRFCLKREKYMRPIFKLKHENDGGGVSDFFNNDTHQSPSDMIAKMINLCTGLEVIIN